MIPLFKVFMSEDVIQPVSDILLSGYVGQGPKVEEFEAELKKTFGNEHLLTVNSCTSALQLAVHMIKRNFSSDDEILVTPLTCFASVSAILANDVKIKWVDVDPSTCNMDLDDLERKLTPNTRGVMVVHWGGCPVDLDRLESIKARYRETFGKELYVIEDCAHCWNTKYKTKIMGQSGNFCCFSFQAIKFLTTGDGGLLILPDYDSYKHAKNLRWFGLDRDSGASFRCIQNINHSGFKYHMNDISATIGLHNLPHIAGLVKRHQENAMFYRRELQWVCGTDILLQEDSNVESSYWLFTIKVENRCDFVKKMEDFGISTSPVHARCDKHSCVHKYRSFLPGMDYLESRHVSIPCGWWVSDEDRAYIVDCIRKAI